MAEQYRVKFVQIGFLHDSGYFHAGTRKEAAPCLAGGCKRVYERVVDNA